VAECVQQAPFDRIVDQFGIGGGANSSRSWRTTCIDAPMRSIALSL